MDNTKHVLNINKFQRLFLNIFKTSIQLFDKYADKTIKQQIFVKSQNEKFTNIDWVLQKLFENQLNKNFPSLKFIGEENTKETHSEITNEKMFDEFLTEPTEELSNNTYDILNKPEYISDANEINIEECCIYADPIDSTSSLIKYKFAPVTSLVGVTHKGQALLGLIFFPRYREENNPTLFFNIPGKGIFKYSYKTEKLERLEKVKRDYFHFAITESRENETQRQSNIITFNNI